MKKITEQLITDFFAKFTEMEYLKQPLVSAVEEIVKLAPYNKVMVCGNGGSAADSEHISGELLKGFLLKRPVPQVLRKKLTERFEGGDFSGDNLQMGVKCIPLVSLTSASTAFLNDCNPQLVFAQLVNALGISGDVLIAISTSGNSKNVVYAAKVAKVLGVKVVALTGAKGGALKQIADLTLNVPSDVTHLIQEYHLPVYHLICMCVESELFDE